MFNFFSYLKQKLILQYFLALAIIIALYILIKLFFYYYTENTLAYKNNNNLVLGISIPKNLNFCGEPIPSDNIAIKKNIEEEFLSTSNWKQNANLIFNKAERWFPYIEPILKEEKVPNDFKYVAVIESHLSNVVSPAGAVGFWQLVESSAKNFDLEITENIDERYDVEKSTRAACKLFKQAYAEFNNYTLSAAAYNLGIGGIAKALKTQNTNNYYELKLNAETKAFVYRILAYKTLLQNPENFGIKRKPFKSRPKLSFKNVSCDSTITNIKNFAQYVKCPLLTFKIFNPWLINNKLINPNKKKYIFKIPSNINEDYSLYMRDLIGEDGIALDNTGLNIQPDNVIDSVKTIYHIVAEKETLAELAEFYEVKLEFLKKINNIPDSTVFIKSGIKIKIQYPVKKN